MAIIRFETYNAASTWEGKKSFEESEAEARATAAAEGGVNFKGATGWQNDLTVWTWETHSGLCLRDREMNGYDDSDFYMLVYSPETDSFKEIMFATTRGWSYPAMNSYVDATPDVVAKWEAKKAADAKAAQELQETVDSMKPEVGKTVEVIKGRKVPKGVVALVFWVGAGTKYTPNFGYSKYQRVPNRLGLKDSNGNVYWTSADNVQVI